MEFKKNRIILDKAINNLDRFVIDIVEILKKHTDYVLVSGYVAILFGRSRTTEDVDMLIPRMDISKFKTMYKDIKKKFWCINAENPNELFDMLKTGHSIRFAVKKKAIPNMEIKFMKNDLDKESFSDRIEVVIGKNTLLVSPIEMQIAYKEKILKSEKDMEDALHLREVFKDRIKKEKIKYYERMISEYG